MKLFSENGPPGFYIKNELCTSPPQYQGKEFDAKVAKAANRKTTAFRNHRGTKTRINPATGNTFYSLVYP
jgi:hypothetical protein